MMLSSAITCWPGGALVPDWDKVTKTRLDLRRAVEVHEANRQQGAPDRALGKEGSKAATTGGPPQEDIAPSSAAAAWPPPP